MFEVIRNAHFEDRRGIIEYAVHFPEEFTRELATLGPQHHLVSYGAGVGNDGLEYLQNEAPKKLMQLPKEHYPRKDQLIEALYSGRPRNTKAKVTGITYKINETSKRDYPEIPKQFELKTGKLVEDPTLKLQRANLQIDFFGPLSYSGRPDLVLNRYIEALDPEGSLWVMLGPVERKSLGSAENQNGFDAHMLNSRVELPNGKSKSLANWIRELPGLKVELFKEKVYAGNNHLGKPVYLEYQSLKIKRDPNEKHFSAPELELKDVKNSYTKIWKQKN